MTGPFTGIRFWLHPLPELWDCDGAVLLQSYRLPSGREVQVFSVWNLP